VIEGLAPRQVTLAGTVDAAGKRVEAKRVGETYRAAGSRTGARALVDRSARGRLTNF